MAEHYLFYSTSKEELSEFVESLTREQFAKVQEFFDTMPKIKKELSFTCNKCGYQENIFECR